MFYSQPSNNNTIVKKCFFFLNTLYAKYILQLPEMLSNVRIKEYFMNRKGRPEKVLRASRVHFEKSLISHIQGLTTWMAQMAFTLVTLDIRKYRCVTPKMTLLMAKKFLPSGKMFPSLKRHHMLRNKTEQATSCHRYVSWKGILLSNITGSKSKPVVRSGFILLAPYCAG